MPVYLRKIPVVFAYLELENVLYELQDRNAVEKFGIKIDDILRIDNLGVLRVSNIVRQPFHDADGQLVHEIGIEVERVKWRK